MDGEYFIGKQLIIVLNVINGNLIVVVVEEIIIVVLKLVDIKCGVFREGVGCLEAS